jgi:condensation domain-containing protein
MGERVAIPFAGDGSGVAELTWGQLSIWQSIEVSGQSRTVTGMTPLPAGATVRTVAGSIGWIVGRHQALRTRYRLRANEPPLQDCSATGVLSMELVDAAGRDAETVAAEIRDRLQREHYDYENDWPLRVAVVTVDGAPVWQVVVYLHLSLDAGGMTALVTDLFTRDPDTGVAPPVTSYPPLEQARRQREPSAQRTQAGSLRHFERVLRAVPAQPFGPPRPGVERDHLEIRFSSRATLLAVRAAGAPAASVLLAAFAVALARAKGGNPVMALVAVSNRFRPGLADSVSSVSQVTPLMVDVADVTLEGAVRRAATGSLTAYKNGYSDPYAQDVVVDRVNAERGEEVELVCYYNDRRQRDTPDGPVPTAAEIRAALPASTVDWPDDPEKPRTGLYVYVADDDPDAIDFIMSVDLRYWTRAELEALVRDIEATVVATALDPTAPTGVRTTAAATS